MKLSVYLRHYLINDIILLLIIVGLLFLGTDVLNKNKPDEDATVELNPVYIDENEELS